MPGAVVPAANTAVIVNHMELNGYTIISRLSGVASHLACEHPDCSVPPGGLITQSHLSEKTATGLLRASFSASIQLQRWPVLPQNQVIHSLHVPG